MEWTRKAVTAMAVAAICMTAAAGASEVYAQAGANAQSQSAAAIRQCRNACNTPFQRCIAARTDEDTCRNRWRLCRQACQPAGPAQTPAPTKK